jgi:hypothetical protein
MTDGQPTTRPEPDSTPFKVHLLTRAGRIMRARSEPVRAFSNKDEAVRFAEFHPFHYRRNSLHW